MPRHDSRATHFLVGEGFIDEEPLLPDGNLFAEEAKSAADPSADNRRDADRAFKFGRMFTRRAGPSEPGADCKELIGLLELGRAMNQIPQGVGAVLGQQKDDLPTPSGYTYLGQFLTHEITFDKTSDLATALLDVDSIEQGRTPSIDLDSVYGRGPTDSTHGPRYYKDHARLKEGETFPTGNWPVQILFDLPRGADGPGDIRAVIPDPRNDENLAVSQMHLAFIKFHNAVVQRVADGGAAREEQFEKARALVVRHFQWIVLKHFLPHIIDGNVLDCVVSSAKAHGSPKFFAPSEEHGLFMPVEFSAAAFRLGHSMVRGAYEWNHFHSTEAFGPTPILELFLRGGFSGDLNKKPRLESDWVIDWRRFFDFRELGMFADGPEFNRAKSIDTNFNFQLNTVPAYPHPSKEAFRPLTVRNLIRGFTLGLPTGQEVADAVGVPRIPSDKIALGPHAKLLRDYGFHERTPLWYYILKEAELPEGGGEGYGGGRRLGPVGSRIVAEALVGILMWSEYSILRDGWTPTLGDRDGIFDMADLLKFTKAINPVGI